MFILNAPTTAVEQASQMVWVMTGKIRRRDESQILNYSIACAREEAKETAGLDGFRFGIRDIQLNIDGGTHTLQVVRCTWEGHSVDMRYCRDMLFQSDQRINISRLLILLMAFAARKSPRAVRLLKLNNLGLDVRNGKVSVNQQDAIDWDWVWPMPGVCPLITDEGIHNLTAPQGYHSLTTYSPAAEQYPEAMALKKVLTEDNDASETDVEYESAVGLPGLLYRMGVDIDSPIYRRMPLPMLTAGARLLRDDHPINDVVTQRLQEGE